MDHLAIMKKSLKLTSLILDGKKTIESRWYKQKRSPWNKIKKNEIIYFKDSGEPVKFKAEVKDIIQFENPNHKQILEQYGKEIGITNIDPFLQTIRNKKYCILIFLKNPTSVKPFEINKKGFGLMSAWITISSIDEIKK